MALHPLVPRAVVHLDRPRTLAFTLDAMLRLQEAKGAIDLDFSEAGILRDIHTYLWCALVDGDREDVTPDDVRGMLHFGNLAALSEPLVALVAGAVPEGKAEKPAAKGKPAKAAPART